MDIRIASTAIDRYASEGHWEELLKFSKQLNTADLPRESFRKIIVAKVELGRNQGSRNGHVL